MSKIRIYRLSNFDRGAKARWLLTEMGVDFEEKILSRDEKEHESPEFLKLNPMGSVPVLQMGEVTMFESTAICVYLADHFADRGMAPAASSADRAPYLQWMLFSDSTLATCQTRIMIIEDIPKGEVYDAKESQLESDFRDVIAALDQTLAKAQFLVGNRFTAADICVSYHLYMCKLWPELDTIAKAFPRVNAYLDRLRAMPSAIRAEVFSYPASG